MPEFDEHRLRDEEQHGGFSEHDDTVFSAEFSAESALEDSSGIAPSSSLSDTASSETALSEHHKVLAETPAAKHQPSTTQPSTADTLPTAESATLDAIDSAEHNPDAGSVDASTLDGRTEGQMRGQPVEAIGGQFGDPKQQAHTPLGFGTPARTAKKPQPSWLSRNVVPLAVTAVLSVLAGSLAAYFINAQNHTVQSLLARLKGKATNAPGSTDSTMVAADASAQDFIAGEASESPSSTTTSSANDNVLVIRESTRDSSERAIERADTTKIASAFEPAANTPPVEKPASPASTAAQARAKTDSTTNGTTQRTTTAKPQSSMTTAPNTISTTVAAQQRPLPVRRFVVQVYSTPSPFAAERMKRQLQMRGLPLPQVIAQDLGNRILYRVRFGNYASKAEALRAADRSGYYDTWVTQQ